MSTTIRTPGQQPATRDGAPTTVVLPIRPSARIPISARARRPTVLSASGAAIDAATSYPIAGLNVVARAEAGGPILGTAVTDEGGRYRIDFRDEVGRERLARLAIGAETAVLEVRPPGRAESYLVTAPASGGAFFKPILRVDLPRPRLVGAIWHTIGERMERSHLVQLHALTRELLLPPHEGLFGDLDIETRHAAVAELEYGFLDPTGAFAAIESPTFATMRAPGGLEAYEQRVLAAFATPTTRAALADLAAKVGSFASLLDVDWVTDPMELKSGKIGPATTKFSGAYAAPSYAPHVAKPTDLSRYRDYLLAIWTGGPHAKTATANLQMLATRFHQQFTTLDVVGRPAAQVLAPIVKTILTASTGNAYGFGIPAADIEAKGTRTDREYLDYLIGLSGMSADALGLRYRLDLGRSDAASSPVQENIHTLQRLFGDSFQDHGDPLPIVPDELIGRAPFFLFYEEWLDVQKPFYAENVYQPASTFSSGITAKGRKEVEGDAATHPEAAWLDLLMKADDSIAKLRQRLEQGELAQARDALDDLAALAWQALDQSYEPKALGAQVQSDQTVIDLDASDLTMPELQAYAAEIVDTTIATAADLEAFTWLYQVGNQTYETPGQLDHPKLWEWLNGNRTRLWVGLIHLIESVIPAYAGDVALASGEYEDAIFHYRKGTRSFLAHAGASSEAGYRPYSVSLPEAVADPGLAATWAAAFDDSYPPHDVLYDEGGLPYTIELATKPYTRRDRDYEPIGEAARTVAVLNEMEQRFFRLRQGEAMLAWADALYRSDERSNIQRARELYKDVLWLHGSMPPMFPIWDGFHFYVRHSENPAVTSQKGRARAALTQIEAGLNVYGASDELIPLLRHKPLKEAADRLAASAKGAQADFMIAMSKIEEALREELVTNTMLRKAQLLAQIADEQAKIAEVAVAAAENQVAGINKAIEAKRSEIEDHDSLFGQFEDVIGGMVDILVPVAKGAGGIAGAGEAAQVGAGFSYAEAGGLAAAAGGGAIMGGYGVFMYAGITSLSDANDAQTGRKGELAALRDVALPLAEAQVGARKREVTIANLEREVAVADAELAQALLKFEATRFMGIRLWTEIAKVMRRVMRRYLALGARFGWLAERALAYEQDRQLDIIRFDYFPEKLQGITGADLLQADLAELEASRLDGMRQRLPIQRTYSLAFDFPLAFAKLRKTGGCTFATSESALQLAYPGTFGYRVRAVDARVTSYAGTPPLRGLLTNAGASTVSRSDGTTHASIRPSESAPLSEFRLADDMAVFGLPGETLFTFEGSGIDTVWTLELTPAGNPTGLDAVADVEISFDLLASWTAELRQKHLASAPTSIDRFVLLSGQKQDPEAIAALAGDAPAVEIEFDLTDAGLPSQESGRVITNIAILLPGAHDSVAATLESDGGDVVAVQIEGGYAVSNAPPLTDDQSTAIPSPLNAFAGETVDQTFGLTIDKSENPTVDFSAVVDVVLGVQYTATIPLPSGVS